MRNIAYTVVMATIIVTDYASNSRIPLKWRPRYTFSRVTTRLDSTSAERNVQEREGENGRGQSMRADRRGRRRSLPRFRIIVAIIGSRRRRRSIAGFWCRNGNNGRRWNVRPFVYQVVVGRYLPRRAPSFFLPLRERERERRWLLSIERERRWRVTGRLFTYFNLPIPRASSLPTSFAGSLPLSPPDDIPSPLWYHPRS